ncbi:MAG: hypothetical protein NZ903_03135, partial [Candidatus Micrarchaeota archaeon]|nr:hypothetical protein [Candidatus Micrarchaeota archaeon]
MLSYILSAQKTDDTYFHLAITSQGSAIVKYKKELNPGSWLEISGESEKIDEDTFQIMASKVEIAINPDMKEVKKIKDYINRKSKPAKTDFYLKDSEINELSKSILEVAKYIKEACVLKRPIIVRYDSDQDGLSGAVALYYALKEYYNIKFIPQQFPFYSKLDFEEDKRYIEHLEAKHLPPVLVTIDFGFNPESEEAYRLAKDYGFSIVVIDHHPPQKQEIKDLTEAILSPWLFNVKNPSSYAAGMLACEIANSIGKIERKVYEKLIRVSLTSDRSKFYKPTKEDLKISEAIGYVLTTSSYDSSISQYAKAIEDEELLDFAYAQSQEKIQNFIEKVSKSIKSKSANGAALFFVDVTHHIKKGSYPNKGLAANILAELLGNKKS